ISRSEAQDHRSNHYASLTSVDDVLELPGDFSQTEALFTIAGRASASELETLIVQSTQVIDRYDRQAALDILFSRYTELDPHAAVDFLLGMNLDIDDQILSSIFINWSKLDLQEAIMAANQIANPVQRRKAGHAILTAASRHSYGDIDRINAQLSDFHDTAYLRSSAIGLRANYDPQSALFEALNMKQDGGRYDAIRRVGVVWARNDPVAALTALESIPNRGLRDRYLAAVYQQWVADDPEGAVQSVLGIADTRARDQQLEKMLRSYTSVNPMHALELAAGLSGQARHHAYAEIFDVWVATDPDAAVQAVSTLATDANEKDQLLNNMARRLAWQNTEQAVALINTLSPQQRDSALDSILMQIAESDPEGAMAMARATESPGKRQRQMSGVLENMSQSNPQLALQYIHELPHGRRRDQLYQKIAAQWAATDSAAALAWAATLQGDSYVQAISGMASQLVHDDPQQAATLLRQIPAAQRGQLLTGIASAMSRRAPRDALNWLAQFSGDRYYEQAVAGIIHHVAERDPIYALNVAEGLSNEQRYSATRIAISTWAVNDPAAAATWASRSTPEIQHQTVTQIVNTWAQSDPLAALDWAKTLRAGDVRDAALVTLTLSSTLNVNEISGVVSRIESSEARDQVITSTWLNLHRDRHDPQAASEFLNRVGASAELRQRLLSYGGG
ncbi:MAG: hypothetical protein HKN70_10490, partial [Gammaproteobacteria bacterium]|nr:hypothetical protein [Gammaproteobacteria bacterium]